MFPTKKLFHNKDTEKFKDDKTDYRAKKISHVKKKSKKSPTKMLNYKQAWRNRLTVKQGIFPNAIQTNILSRINPGQHSPKASFNNEAINQRLKNHNNFLNRLFREEKPSNQGFSGSPPRNAGQKSFRIANCPSRMSLDATPSPQKNIVSSDSINYYKGNKDINENISQLSPVSMTKDTEETSILSADFSYYSPEQAQQILLYQEVGQIVNKTMIMEKVNNFGNFPDTLQGLRNKLWEIRSSRDENFDPEACSTTRKANTFDPFSDDEQCSDKSSPLFDSSMQDFGESKTPKSAEMDEKLTTPPFEFKPPDRRDMRKNRAKYEPKLVARERASMDSDEEIDESEVFTYRPKENERSRKKRFQDSSIFNSTLVPTCKLDQNLTLNPIEFLENLTKNDDKEARKRHEEFNTHQSPTFSDYCRKLDNRKPTHRYPTEWFNNPTEPFQKGNLRLSQGEYHMNVPNRKLDIPMVGFMNVPNRKLDIPMKHPADYKREEFTAKEIGKTKDRGKEFFSMDYIFPSVASSQTPEMKYYPCRLY